MPHPLKVPRWFDKVIDELEGIKVTPKSARRIRLDLVATTLPALLALLKGQFGYHHLSSISCIDWPESDEFELVYHLVSYETKVVISAHIRIKRAQAHFVSVYDIYSPAGFFERDIHEMFGVYFEGAPTMDKFILTDWDGPPPMLKSFDTEAYVQETFQWQEYQPDWLKEIQNQGGGIVP